MAAVKYARVRTFAISATRALAYFDDAEALPMPLMDRPDTLGAVKQFLERQAMEAGRKHLEDLWPQRLTLARMGWFKNRLTL